MRRLSEGCGKAGEEPLANGSGRALGGVALAARRKRLNQMQQQVITDLLGLAGAGREGR